MGRNMAKRPKLMSYLPPVLGPFQKTTWDSVTTPGETLPVVPRITTMYLIVSLSGS